MEDMFDQLSRLVASLRAERDSLRKQVALLSLDQPTLSPHVPAEWGLTSKESEIAEILLQFEGQIVRSHTLRTTLWPNDADAARRSGRLPVFICKIRGKLKARGVIIETKERAGYALHRVAI